MNRILLITTGGTLACTPTPRGLVPTLKGRDILEYSRYPDADISVLDFRLIDSSVMTDDDRARLDHVPFDQFWNADRRYKNISGSANLLQIFGLGMGNCHRTIFM